MKISLESKQMDVLDERIPYRLINMLSVILIALAFVVSSPQEISSGLSAIFYEPGTLITDYIKVGGLGATLLNVGLMTLLFNYILSIYNINYNGTTYAAIFLIAGFSFFGKNLLNIWPIVIGVFLYSKYQKEDFRRYIYVAMFGTAMSPIISEILLFSSVNLYLRIFLGLVTGILMGFILPNVAAYLVKVHHGFNLYNIGFASGVIGTIFVSIYKSYGLKINAKMLWSSGNNFMIAVPLYILFFIMIALGYHYNGKSFKGMKYIYRSSGRLVSDFVASEGHGRSFINMGLNGLASVSMLLLLQGDLNGPTIAGIFTIVGFGAFGKHLKNIVPIWLGVIIGVVTRGSSFSHPGIQLAFLFSTGLAPIAGEYGLFYGILAGFIHSSVVMYIGVLHGGINLYNNGFSAGLIAGFLVPLIDSFKRS